MPNPSLHPKPDGSDEFCVSPTTNRSENGTRKSRRIFWLVDSIALLMRQLRTISLEGRKRFAAPSFRENYEHLPLNIQKMADESYDRLK